MWLWIPILACTRPFPSPERADPRALLRASGDTGGLPLIDPIAVGFEFEGVVRADGTIQGFRIYGNPYDPSMRLMVAGYDFFYNGDQTDVCTFYAIPYAPPERGCDLPTYDGADVYRSYESMLALAFDDCGGRLDPALHAQLTDAFEGMRLGIGFAPMTPYLQAAWDPATFATYQASMTAMYVALVDPDGTWDGDDWTTAISWAWNPANQEVVIVGGYYVDIPATTTGAFNEAWVTTYAYWYQDFPLMDFTRLDEVVGGSCDCTPGTGDTGAGGDADGDGVCDTFDACPLDALDDSDGDGVCDSDDPCPTDAPDDTDGDGVCDSLDPCPADSPDDTDGDGVCDSLDPCPADALDDSDGDGVCDSLDPCPADTFDDRDGDGVCDTDDPCPVDPQDDRDGDGVCDSDDPCPADPLDDSDKDGVCDRDDPCPADPADDGDGDGSCDSDDPCPTDPADACDDVGPTTPTGPTTSPGATGGDPDEEPAKEGCGCASPAGPAALLLAVPALLALRRRKDGSIG